MRKPPVKFPWRPESVRVAVVPADPPKSDRSRKCALSTAVTGRRIVKTSCLRESAASGHTKVWCGSRNPGLACRGMGWIDLFRNLCDGLRGVSAHRDKNPCRSRGAGSDGQPAASRRWLDLNKWESFRLPAV